MSLQLLEGYSSADEEEPTPAAAAVGEETDGSSRSSDASSDESDGEIEQKKKRTSRNFSQSDPARPPPDPSLPSALDAFAEITGPPEFLRNAVGGPQEETREALGVLDRSVRDRSRRNKRDLPPGAVVEAKAQLVAIRDRVSVDGGNATSDNVTAASGENKRKITAADPGPEDAADLLRMCLQCGVPKTYSHAQGVVCPICGDRPIAEPKAPEKKGSTVKDKEKSKRMRGQSSHATWKSETEMALRQQFD